MDFLVFIRVDKVQKNKLTKGVFSTLLIASTIASAGEYPAANFQPTIVYQDSSIKEIATTTKTPATVSKETSNTAPQEADSKYPAANFQPQVVYSDSKAQSVATASSSSTVEKNHSSSNEVDSKYPAANFQPHVVYTDTKASSSVETVVKSVPSNSSVSTVEENIAPTTKAKESDSSYLLALVGLVAAGFFFFRGQDNSNVKTGSAASTGEAPAKTRGATGVARYINRVSGTGVSRYLEKQAKKTPATGVAKYMARQAITAKTAKTEAATGVEKYLRDRG